MRKVLLHAVTAKNGVACVLLFAVLTMGVGNSTPVQARTAIPVTAISTVRCLYRLLKSNSVVRAVDVYAIDEARSAVEFRFRGKSGNVMIADLMLVTLSKITYDVTIPQDESQEAGWEALAILSTLNVDSICRVFPALDDMVPGPEPRDGWQPVDSSTFVPAPVPKPTLERLAGSNKQRFDTTQALQVSDSSGRRWAGR